MSAGQTGHMTGQMGQMGHVHGTDGTHTRGCPAKILYVYWCFLSPMISQGKLSEPLPWLDYSILLAIAVSSTSPLESPKRAVATGTDRSNSDLTKTKGKGEKKTHTHTHIYIYIYIQTLEHFGGAFPKHSPNSAPLPYFHGKGF